MIGNTVGVRGVETESWQRFRAWHQLFDTLCERAGHHDNAALASAYCALVGRSASGDFEVAQKNLRSWRRGRHLPLRRNAVVLARLLGVEEDAELRRHWNALYVAARREALAETEDPPQGAVADETVGAEPAMRADGSSSPLRRRALRRGALAAAVVLAVGGGLHGLVRDRADDDLPVVNYEARVRMVVGESRLINANRGDCKRQQAPDWNRTVPRVPMSSLGTFSDGGVAWTPSVFCNDIVLARAVRFTATHAGEEEVELLGSYIKIVVTEAGRSPSGEANLAETEPAGGRPDLAGPRGR